MDGPSGTAHQRSAGRIPPAATAALALLIAACAPGEPAPSPTDPGPAPPDPGLGELTLAWSPPAADAEGGELDDLGGYRLYYATTSPVTRASAEMVDVGDTTRHTLTDLEEGVYFVAVAAVDTAGNSSELSDELRAEVGDP